MTKVASSLKSYDEKAAIIIAASPICRDLLGLWPLQRLKKIRFLGGIQFYTEDDPTLSLLKTNRYLHSVGVAYLALLACRARQVNQKQESTVLAAALLHDVGHGPLSHSTERYFFDRWAIDHRVQTGKMILGELDCALRVPEVLNDYGVSPERVASMIIGRHGGQDSYLLSSAINVDTLDGVCRSLAFFRSALWEHLPEWFLQVLVRPADNQIRGDIFWSEKSILYNSYILDPRWSIYDDMVCNGLRRAGGKVSLTDFLLTDEEFCWKFADELACAGQGGADKTLAKVGLCGEDVGRRRIRNFEVDNSVELTKASDIDARYIEKG
jgi:hypothetical protein